MVSCIGDLDWSICSNRLKLPTDKTANIILRTRQQIEKPNFHSIKLDGIVVHLPTTFACPGVLIDSELSFSAHIKRLTGRCFYQFRQLRSVRRAQSVEAARTLVHAFVNSRVDYCNSIFWSTSAVHLRPSQCILNAAVPLIVKRWNFDRITDSLRDEQHWLPYQSSTGIPTRYAFSSTNVCMKLFHRASLNNVYRMRSTIPGAVLPTAISRILGQPCALRSA